MAKILEKDESLKEHAREDLGIEIDSFEAEGQVGRHSAPSYTSTFSRYILKSHLETFL